MEIKNHRYPQDDIIAQTRETADHQVKVQERRYGDIPPGHTIFVPHLYSDYMRHRRGGGPIVAVVTAAPPPSAAEDAEAGGGAVFDGGHVGEI